MTAAAQAGAQLFAFGAGIVVIRSLDPEQYAYYTIAMAALGMMTVLSDSGVTSAVLSQAGPVWQDSQRLAATLAAGLDIRRRLAGAAIAVAVPIVIALARHQGASWLTSGLLALSIIPMFISLVASQLLESVPRLRQRIVQLQAIQFGNNLGRFVAVVAVVPLWPVAAVAALVAAAPQLLATRQLRKLASRDVPDGVAADPEVKRRLAQQMRRTMPGAIYYALSGQLTIWLISIFGHRAAVASVGALGRLAAVMALFAAVFSTVAIPHFARIPRDQQRLAASRFYAFQALLAAACLVPVIGLAAFPEPVLAILGPHYEGLAGEATLMGLSAVVWTVAGGAFGLAAARGVIAPPMISVSCSVALQVALILLLPVNTVLGVIGVGLGNAIGQWLIYVVNFSLATRPTR